MDMFTIGGANHRAIDVPMFTIGGANRRAIGIPFGVKIARGNKLSS
jgi:hypothetical protein